jgi:hypothetical protein
VLPFSEGSMKRLLMIMPFFNLKLYKYHFDCGTCLGCVFPYGLLYPFFSVALWVYKLLKYFASFLLKRAHANSRLCTKY